MLEYTRQVSSGKDNYEKIAREAGIKVNGNPWHLLTKAFLGGWFVGLGGHAACVIGSLYFEPNTNNPSSRASFAIVFPAALVAILMTGSDLYTGNTMSFTFALAKRHISLLNGILKLVISIFGNYLGAALGALILAGGTNHFLKGEGIGAQYMIELAKSKTSKPFWRLMFSAIGCNSLVCLAVWSFYASYDAAGAVINVFTFIGAFAVGGLEHTIANFYVLNAALVSQSDVTFFDVYVKNLIPVWLGNTIAGVCFLGIPIAFVYTERPKDLGLSYPEKVEDNVKMLTA